MFNDEKFCEYKVTISEITTTKSYMLFYSKKSMKESTRQSISLPQNWPHVSSKIKSIAESGSPSKKKKNQEMNNGSFKNSPRVRNDLEFMENDEMSLNGVMSLASHASTRLTGGSSQVSKKSIPQNGSYKKKRTFFENTTIDLLEVDEFDPPENHKKDKRH